MCNYNSRELEQEPEKVTQYGIEWGYADSNKIAAWRKMVQCDTDWTLMVNSSNISLNLGYRRACEEELASRRQQRARDARRQKAAGEPLD